MEVESFAEIAEEFLSRAHTMVWCNVATMDRQNRLRSRVLHPIWEVGDAGPVGWIATRRHSLKTQHLDHNPYVSLAYVADPIKPAYADCLAAWDDTPEAKAHVWDLFRTAPPPLGYDPEPIFKAVDDPDYGILRLTPWRMELGSAYGPAHRQIWHAEGREM
jgi:hypothetical protein